MLGDALFLQAQHDDVIRAERHRCDAGDGDRRAEEIEERSEESHRCTTFTKKLLSSSTPELVTM